MVGAGDADPVVPGERVDEALAVGQQVGALVVVVRVAADAVEVVPADHVADPDPQAHEPDREQRPQPPPGRSRLVAAGRGLSCPRRVGREGVDIARVRFDVRRCPSHPGRLVNGPRAGAERRLPSASSAPPGLPPAADDRSMNLR